MDSVMDFIFTFLAIFFVVLMISRRRSKSRSKAPKLPPGPRKLPIIGNVHQLAGVVPHRALASLAKKYGPVMHLQLGSVSSIVVTSPGIAKEIMRTHDLIFANRPALFVPKITTYDFKDIAFCPYGNYWRQLRKICTIELLSANSVQSYRSIREEEVMKLVKMLSANAGKPVNITEEVYSMTYGITGRAAFGEKCKEQAEFIYVMQEEIKLASGFSICDLYPSVKVLQIVSGLRFKVEKLHREAGRILQNIVNQSRRKRATRKAEDGGPAECFLEVLLRLQEQGELSLEDTNIKAIITDVFTAGSETSSTTVDWAMSEMLKNPRVLREAQDEVRWVFKGKGNVDEGELQELKYLKSVVKETLRLHAPIPLLLPRESSQSCEINGYEIPAKTRVIINAWALGRDPSFWDEPEKFYPERFLDSPIDYMGTDFGFIPFGAGRRICPGILFGQANILLPLAQLLFHFDWKLPSGMEEGDLDMTEMFGLTARRKSNLILVPNAYCQTSSVEQGLQNTHL